MSPTNNELAWRLEEKVRRERENGQEGNYLRKYFGQRGAIIQDYCRNQLQLPMWESCSDSFTSVVLSTS